MEFQTKSELIDMDISELTILKTLCSQVRRDILRMVHGAKSGHPGGALGCTEYMVALYSKVMNKKDVFQMDGRDEDIFFLSNGHLSALWYSVLARTGHFDIQELGTFRKINSRLQGHPATHEGLPGVRVASGSLGQGLSVAIGAALTKKLNNEPFQVYSLHGDGELQEGQIWEAAMFAAHHKVDNLISTIDVNHQQIDGPVVEVLSLGNLHAKWESFGWKVLETDGNNLESLLETFSQAKTFVGKGKPIMILMNTIMGFGVDFMENSHKWHGIPPSDDQLNVALSQLDSSLTDY